MTRQEANKKILDSIKTIVDTYPDLRFHQILQNMHITDVDGEDKWYEESVDTMKKLVMF